MIKILDRSGNIFRIARQRDQRQQTEAIENISVFMTDAKARENSMSKEKCYYNPVQAHLVRRSEVKLYYFLSGNTFLFY